MESIISVKSEMNPGFRHLPCPGDGVDNNTVMENRCIKRRRRAPIMLSNSEGNDISDQKMGVDEHQLQVSDQNSTKINGTTTVKRSSKYRGVSRHRWTGRYEAHLWDKGSWNPTQRKKGKQVYLGAYDEEESAARAYDLAAIKYWGTSTFTNFPISDYEKEIEIMKTVTREEYLASLRRRSSGFSRGVSKYRGVARHHHNGRWEARIGRVFGNKYLYLGTYSTQEEAAHAYDIAAIEYRGMNAVTNFDLSTYIRWLKPEANSAPPTQQPPQVVEWQPMNAPSIRNPENERAQFVFGSNPFAATAFVTAPKEEIRKTSFAPSTMSSSPTALGLLLRSSIFRELVEKNINADDQEEAELLTKSPTYNKDELGVTSINGRSGFPFICSSESLPSLESRENTSPVSIRMEQFPLRRT